MSIRASASPEKLQLSFGQTDKILSVFGQSNLNYRVSYVRFCPRYNLAVYLLYLKSPYKQIEKAFEVKIRAA